MTNRPPIQPVHKQEGGGKLHFKKEYVESTAILFVLKVAITITNMFLCYIRVKILLMKKTSMFEDA